MNGLVLEAEGLAKIYGRGCARCVELTGPERGTNTCSNCGSVVACAGVWFEVGSGEVLGIAGESGSGKSTVAGCLAFDVEPTAGEARFAPFGGGTCSRRTWPRGGGCGASRSGSCTRIRGRGSTST